MQLRRLFSSLSFLQSSSPRESPFNLAGQCETDYLSSEKRFLSLCFNFNQNEREFFKNAEASNHSNASIREPFSLIRPSRAANDGKH